MGVLPSFWGCPRVWQGPVWGQAQHHPDKLWTIPGETPMILETPPQVFEALPRFWGPPSQVFGAPPTLPMFHVLICCSSVTSCSSLQPFSFSMRARQSAGWEGTGRSALSPPGVLNPPSVPNTPPTAVSPKSQPLTGPECAQALPECPQIPPECPQAPPQCPQLLPKRPQISPSVPQFPPNCPQRPSECP